MVVLKNRRMMWMVGMLAAVLLAGEAQAAEKNFSNAGGTEEWMQGTNWVGGTVPLISSSSDAVIGSSSLTNATCYLGRLSSSEAAEARSLKVGGVPGLGVLNIQGGSLTLGGSASSFGNSVAGATGIVNQSAGVVVSAGTVSIGGFNNGYGSWTISGGVWSNTSSANPCLMLGASANGYGELIINGGRYVGTAGAAQTRVGNLAGCSALISISNGGFFESAAGMSLPQAAAKGEVRITGGGVMTISNAFTLANAAGSTGLLYIASGGAFSNLSAAANTIGAPVDSSVNVVVSNGTFYAAGNFTIQSVGTVYPRALVVLDGTNRHFITGPSAFLTVGGSSPRSGAITNNVRKYSGGVSILNPTNTALGVLSGSKIHLVFSQSPVESGDFWGLRWVGTNGYATLNTLVTSSRITWTNTLPPPFNTNTISVYKADDDSYTYIGFKAVISEENAAPNVSAGSPQTIQLPPGTASLNGSIEDDGKPNPSAITSQWSKVDGLGSVVFGDASLEDTTATFDTLGTYVLQLWASDGALEASNTVTITVTTNQAPQVNAGADQLITLAGQAILDATASDDGFPAPAQLTYQWSTVTGPGTVTFANSNALDTTATVDATGSYVLQLTVSDGQLSASDTVAVDVREVATLAAKANGAFNVVTTWDPEMNPMPGDTMNITGYTVTNLVANGVVGTVNLSGSATLWLANLGAPGSPAAVGATINVGTGATLRLNGANNAINCTNVNLNGGTLAFNGGSLAAGSVLRVNNDSLITPISSSVVGISAVVHGSGKLTVTANGGLSVSACEFAVGSTWNGAWDIQGNIRMDGSASSRNMPGDVRVAPGQELRFDSAGPHVFKGTRSGGGTNSAYQTSNFRVGDGTGNGKMSPGDSGAGNITFANYGGAFPLTLTFNTNSTYEVDVAGATSSLYDSVTVVGGVGSNGIVRLLSGSILTVRMAEPPAGTKSVDVKIIDTVNGSGGDGLLIGDFGVTNWVNAGGWTGLGVIKVGEDLHVQGSFGGSGTLLMVQ